MKSENKSDLPGAEMIPVAECSRFIEHLPFDLTPSQNEAFEDIQRDFSSGFRMNRLLQGDVGSGKTLVALLGFIMAAVNNYQSAFMVPTEVLARQHFESIKNYSEKYKLPLKIGLLTGSVPAKEKKDTKKKLEDGSINLIIGTHALLEDNVSFLNLGFVVTDEQHRFGVNQRLKLSKKGENAHVLVMSATPIPRTLALILYGDLSISVMRDKPQNRLPIKNCVIGKSYEKKKYDFLLREIKAGHQAYIICPAIDETEASDIENVTDYTDRLRDLLPENIRIKSLHGQMNAKDKNRIMEEFNSGYFDILVSTTVIEVGIDVANATLIIIENSERFGLAQLHQLRGRVGRSDLQSYCVFYSDSSNPNTLERLGILNKSNDGFEIAEQDLKLRGPGEFFGSLQSGELAFKLGDVISDHELLETTSRLCDDIILEDRLNQDISYSALKSKLDGWIGNQVDFVSI